MHLLWQNYALIAVLYAAQRLEPRCMCNCIVAVLAEDQFDLIMC